MTVVVNHDTNSVIWCAIGFGSEVLSQFFECLTEEQRASIRCITADGARWIASCISEYCPNAQRCIDPSMWFPGLWKHLKKYGAEHWQQQVLKLDLRKKESLEGLEKERRSNQPLKKRRQ